MSAPDTDAVTLRKALAESLKLQSHYAEQLNMYDGGKRMVFASVEEWLARLRETGTLPVDAAETERVIEALTGLGYTTEQAAILAAELLRLLSADEIVKNAKEGAARAKLVKRSPSSRGH